MPIQRARTIEPEIVAVLKRRSTGVLLHVCSTRRSCSFLVRERRFGYDETGVYGEEEMFS